MDLPEDVARYVERSFSMIDREEALAVLRGVSLGTCRESPARMLRCLVLAARRDLGRLRKLAAEIAIDYRDIVIAGEYVLREGKLARVRNLSSPIAEDEA
jgi:hypothetical protein